MRLPQHDRSFPNSQKAGGVLLALFIASLWMGVAMDAWGAAPPTPFQKPASQGTATATAEEPESLPAGFFLTALRFFQNYISPVDGDRCPSYPTCSAYAVAAVKKHGFVLGYLMTVDRLIHEYDARQDSPVVWVDGTARFYDPVENNDFWLEGDRQSPPAVGLNTSPR
ncbi:MAG: membrane protein insertion efficiency factor YidD [Smithellaceae bacterium]|nr:membrane protein insertion efficiency factor YidD [Smithellaceae bacterium]